MPLGIFLRSLIGYVCVNIHTFIIPKGNLTWVNETHTMVIMRIHRNRRGGGAAGCTIQALWVHLFQCWVTRQGSKCLLWVTILSLITWLPLKLWSLWTEKQHFRLWATITLFKIAFVSPRLSNRHSPNDYKALKHTEHWAVILVTAEGHH